MDPSEHNLPPWLGEEVRHLDAVPKTEILKGHKKKGHLSKKPTKDFTEDAIMELVENQKVLRSTLLMSKLLSMIALLNKMTCFSGFS